MKITKVEVFRLPTANSKQNSPIGCRIHTDVGICGDGEAGMAYGVGGSGAFGMVCDLAELIIGMDPLRTEFIWETMYKRTFWGQNGGPVVFSGIAAIDVALWDIKGKYFNVPCYQLLGGKVRDKLRTYASQLQFGWGQVGVSEHLWAVTPADYAHNVKLALDEGFDAIKINTDEGIYGWGEAGLAYGNSFEAAFGQCQDFAKLIIGMDPFDTEKIWEHLHRHTFWGMGGGVVITSAMAAIDTACWDIKGKALGVPVYKLLGGKTNPKLRAYASQLQFGWSDLIQKDNKGEALGLLFDPKDYYEVTKNALRDGYDAIKVDPVFAPTDPDTPLEKIWGSQGTQIRGCYRQHDLQRSVERIAACREAGGPDMDIIVEIHSLLDANTAAELGKALEPLRIMYFEEPTSPENPSNFRHIKQKCDLPLATGERSYTRWGFRQFFEDRTLSVIQPDLCNTGGITETKKICDMAQVYDMGVQIHVCGGPIATAAALQVEAAIPNFTIHEEHNANLKNIFIQAGKYYYKPENGYYTVPDLPGIGQEMTDEFLATCRKVVIGG